MTPDAFRKIARGIPGAVESAHMDHPDFRRGGRIFASLGYPDDGHGMVRLTPAQQLEFVGKPAKAFKPCKGVWGDRGATLVVLRSVEVADVKIALQLAAENQPAIRKKQPAQNTQPAIQSIRWVAFLRGINLGKRRLKMDRLKALFEDLGLRDVSTFIASGNVVFASDAVEPGNLEARIAEHLRSSLGYDVDTFLRTMEEVKAVGSTRPFSAGDSEAATVHVGFLHKPMAAETARRLVKIRTIADEFEVSDREIYWLCRTRTSESKVWTLPEIKSLKLPSTTMRNLTTIWKLVAKHANAGR